MPRSALRALWFCLTACLAGGFCGGPAVAEPAIAYEAVDLADVPGITGSERLVAVTRNQTELLAESLPPGPAAGGAKAPRAVAQFGPFRVTDPRHAEMVGASDRRTPDQFAAMIRAFPSLAELDLIEVPGTEDDLANLRLGRMIRQYGLTTRVPSGGSVRSGGVELFLAGARRIADPGAEFAVHSWMDEDGKAPSDYAEAAPENRRYTDYYRQMGMSAIEAEAFYAMTNSVPFDSARWFGANVMGLWVRLDNSDAFPG